MVDKAKLTTVQAFNVSDAWKTLTEKSQDYFADNLDYIDTLTESTEQDSFVKLPYEASRISNDDWQ